MFYASLVFLVVLFVYIHLLFYHKVSNDLEVLMANHELYERLDDVLDTRQPVVVTPIKDSLRVLGPMIHNACLEIMHHQYAVFDATFTVGTGGAETTQTRPLADIVAMAQSQPGAKIRAHANDEFLEETGTRRLVSTRDAALRPSFASVCKYDFLFGTAGACTPLLYSVDYRNFFVVTQGRVSVKLVPPKYGRYLHSTEEYGAYLFGSPVDCWAPQEKYLLDFQKVKVLDVVLEPGKILHVPAYWFYSFRYEGVQGDVRAQTASFSSMISARYQTYMNSLGNLHRIAMFLLQSSPYTRTVADSLCATVTGVITPR